MPDDPSREPRNRARNVAQATVGDSVTEKPPGKVSERLRVREGSQMISVLSCPSPEHSESANRQEPQHEWSPYTTVGVRLTEPIPLLVPYADLTRLAGWGKPILYVCYASAVGGVMMVCP
jgi:hypothetical protein